MADVQVEEKTPEWLLRLESRKRKPRLVHEIGAGTPCLTCGDGCPGLDLHFWRKLCRYCKCKKEDHDVKDDEGYEQFEILLGPTKRKLGGVLKFKIPDAEKHSEIGKANAQASAVKFDWVPPDVSDDLATEYMRQIPVGKLPITGSDGAVYRQQQLEKQVPLHDLDASKCHNLSAEEVERLMHYLNNLKNSVVGQGKVTKVPVLCQGNVLHSVVPQQSCHSEVAPIAGVTAVPLHSSQPMHLRFLPPSLNAAPCPFHSSILHSDLDFPSSPPPETEATALNASTFNLKMPSDFVPQWKPSKAGHTVIPYGQGYNVAHSAEGIGQLPPSHAKSHQTHNASALHEHDNHSSSKLDCKNTSALCPPGPTTRPNQLRTGLPEGNILTSSLPFQLQHSSKTSGKAKPLFSQQAVGKTEVNITPVVQSQESIIAASKFPSGMATLEVSQKQFPQMAQPFTDNHFCNISPEYQSNVYSDVSNHNVCTSFSDTNLNNPEPSVFPSNLAYLGAIDGEGNAILRNSYQKEDSNISAPHTVVRDVPSLSKNLAHSEMVAASAFPHSLACSCIIPASQNLEEAQKFHSRCALHHPLEHNADVKNIPCYPSQVVHSGDYPPQITPSQVPLSHKLSNDLSYGMGNVASGTRIAHEPAAIAMFPESALSESVRAPYGVDVACSTVVGSDGMPRSARMMQNADPAVDKGLAEQMAQMSGLGMEHPSVVEQVLKCQECEGNICSGDVAVYAERAGSAPWHPQCFVCHTCKELLVDLMYFYHKGYIYCGRHCADLLHIPRCFACDELIFVKEYTMAEGKAFHVKHLCCYECDVPLGGLKYILKDEQPVCLDCYQEKYGKRCRTCGKMIAAGDQRVTLKDLNWHAMPECFCCYQCNKLLLGGKMVVNQERPFCSKECVQLGLSS